MQRSNKALKQKVTTFENLVRQPTHTGLELPQAQAAGKLREVGESEVKIARQQRPEHLEVAGDSSITIKFQPCA